MSSKKYIATSTIRSILSSSFPSNHNITKQEILQTRIRCRRLMPEFERSEDFQKFEENLNSNSVYLKQVESDFSLEEDEANQMIHELFDSMFNNINSNEKSSTEDDSDHDNCVWKFQDYLKLLSTNVNGFRYRLAIGNDGAINGVVWMTATMRSNMERFGSYICLDSMKRVLNPLKWPYFAIALKNELDYICVGCEALMLQEREDAYRFLLDSAFDMCPNRLKEDVLVVSGDGFFNQRTLISWGLENAKFIADYWHLFDSGLKNHFGSEHYFRILEPNLRNIANAYSESAAFESFMLCKQQLKNMNASGGKVEEQLDKFYGERSTYALYKTRQIPGNRNRRGSSAAEQNHSSVISLFFGDKETKDYMEHIHVMIRDLFTRQKIHTNKFNEGIFGLTNKRAIYLEQLEEENNSSLKHYQLLKDAVTELNFNAFTLFEKEVKQSNNYSVYQTITEDGHIYGVKRINSDAPAREFAYKTQRCMCDFRLTHLMMCRHEICLLEKFSLEYFDIQHHYRSSVTKSFNVGDQKQYKNETNRTIADEILESILDSEENCKIDNLERNIEENTNSCAPDHDNDDDNDDIYGVNNESGDSSEDQEHDPYSQKNNTFNIQKSLPLSSIQRINNEIYNNYKDAPEESKQAMCAILLQVKDFLKTNGKGKFCQPLETDKEHQQNQINSIIESYNQCFLSTNSSFNNTNQVIPDKNSLKKRSRVRLKPRHEREKQKFVRARQSTIPKCSFCKGINHNKRACPRMSELLGYYKIVDDRRSFIDRICTSQPILDPIENLQTSSDALKNTHHVIVHKEIYAIAKSETYGRLDMSQMFFTVTLLSVDNATEVKKEIIVYGGDLERYIHNTTTIKDRLLLDGTQSNTMSSKFKMRNQYQHSFGQNILLPPPPQQQQQQQPQQHRITHQLTQPSDFNQTESLGQLIIEQNALNQFMTSQMSQHSTNSQDNFMDGKMYFM